MPEGPEDRRYTDALDAILRGQKLASVWARTRAAKAWLAEREGSLVGRRVASVRSHGKNLVGRIEDGFFFYAHLLMWGRWQTYGPGEAPVAIDRRERARLVVETGATAILLSAPVFEVGEGDPYAASPYLRALGPDVLPYEGEAAFNAAAFLARLHAPENVARTIGAALLAQTIAAGIGNYLRAEILFVCRLDPWRRVADLTGEDLMCLCDTIPAIADLAYRSGGATVPDAVGERMRRDRSLVYPNSRSVWGSRHWVFRRTNLPCLVCGDTIRQMRQTTGQREDGSDNERILYFCPSCQSPSAALKPSRATRGRRPAAQAAA